MRRTRLASWLSAAALAAAVPFVWSQTPQPPTAKEVPAAGAAKADDRPAAAAALDPAAAVDQKLIALGKDGSQVLANLTYLSDVIGARLTGSENLKRANEWAAETMRSYGLENVRL